MNNQKRGAVTAPLLRKRSLMTTNVQDSISDPFLRAYQILNRVARQRSEVYQCLSIGFYPPDADFQASLASGTYVERLYNAIQWLGEDQSLFESSLQRMETFRSLELQDLDEAYHQLFVKGMERVSPRESTYRWRDITQLSSLQSEVRATLAAKYSQFGVTPVAGMEDHLAVELEFISYLCSQEGSYWEEKSSTIAREYRRKEKLFLDDHLGRWLPELCRRISEHANPSFYQSLAAFSDIWLKIDQGPC
jgi:putative dimethyl sulfoxide reductase chaperone